VYFNTTRIAKIVGAVVFIGAAFLTYGQSLLFEKIYLAVLGFIAVIFIRDINLISLICISATANIASELLYPLVMTSDFQTTFKVLTYTAIILSIIKFREDSLRLSVSLVVAMCLGAELYWYLTDSPAAVIYWYVLLININFLVRHFLFSRVFIMAKYFPKRYRSLNLDHTLYQVVLLYIVVHELVLVEYVLRRVFDVPTTVVYYAAPYLFHGLTAYTALLIYIQGYTLISKSWFKA
jgi:hypothetical protein